MEVDLGWNEFKEWLGKGLKALRVLGVSDENAEELSYRFGDLLNRYIDPSNREQRLLKELWDQGNEVERRALASMLARLVERDTLERKKPSRLSGAEGPDETTDGRQKP